MTEDEFDVKGAELQEVLCFGRFFFRLGSLLEHCACIIGVRVEFVGIFDNTAYSFRSGSAGIP